MEISEARLSDNVNYPRMVYAESIVFFFGANFLFHQNVFRRTNSRPHFAVFMLVNAFTSFQLAEATNTGALKYYAAGLNNAVELHHRAQMNEALRKKLYLPKT